MARPANKSICVKKGLDIQVFLATAEIVPNPTPANQLSDYAKKYGQEIRDMGASEEDVAGAYSVAIRVQPKRLRGMTIPA